MQIDKSNGAGLPVQYGFQIKAVHSLLRWLLYSVYE